MLRGYSLAAVSSILAVVVKAFIETRDQGQAPSEPLEAQREALAFLESALAQWEKDVLPTASDLPTGVSGTAVVAGSDDPESGEVRPDSRPFKLGPCRTSARTRASAVASVAGEYFMAYVFFFFKGVSR